MKLRTGFVSNSSSSSFVIYKPLLSESQIDEIGQWFYINEDEIYDDSGASLHNEGNYISINCHSKSHEFHELLTEKLGIKDEDVYTEYR